METDYATITRNYFEKVVRHYAIYRLLAQSAFSEIDSAEWHEEASW